MAGPHVAFEKCVGCPREDRLDVKVKKSEFGKKFLEYLGHTIGSGVLAIPDQRVSDLVQYRLPKSRRDLRAFMGGVSYYRRFLPGLAALMARLSPAMSKTARAPWSGVRRCWRLSIPSWI